MAVLSVISLVLGILCGAWLLPPEAAPVLSTAADWALLLLMFSVGLSMGQSRCILRCLRENGAAAFAVPAGVIGGTLLGGWVVSVLLGMEPGEGMAVAAAMAWYSLGGAMVTDLAGAQLGAVTFLSGVFRELLSFLFIPLLARTLGGYAAIAPAAATSGDTALPIIARAADEETAVVSVLSGLVCTLAVPIVIEVVYHVF